MILVLLAALQVKHLVADYLLQSEWMVAGKARYGGAGGLAHVAVHGAGSLIILLAFGVPIAGTALLVLGEGLIHYHVDWAKARLSRRHELSPEDRGYWFAVGADQFAHQITYLVMVALALP